MVAVHYRKEVGRQKIGRGFNSKVRLRGHSGEVGSANQVLKLAVMRCIATQTSRSCKELA